MIEIKEIKKMLLTKGSCRGMNFLESNSKAGFSWSTSEQTRTRHIKANTESKKNNNI